MHKCYCGGDIVNIPDLWEDEEVCQQCQRCHEAKVIGE